MVWTSIRFSRRAGLRLLRVRKVHNLPRDRIPIQPDSHTLPISAIHQA
jgi:hypothetical protein